MIFKQSGYWWIHDMTNSRKHPYTYPCHMYRVTTIRYKLATLQRQYHVVMPFVSTTLWISSASKGQEALAILGHPAQWDPKGQGDANPPNNRIQLAKGSTNLYKYRYSMWPAELIQSSPKIEPTSCANSTHKVSSVSLKLRCSANHHGC